MPRFNTPTCYWATPEQIAAEQWLDCSLFMYKRIDLEEMFDLSHWDGQLRVLFPQLCVLTSQQEIHGDISTFRVGSGFSRISVCLALRKSMRRKVCL